jgi:hypothetical protein
MIKNKRQLNNTIEKGVKEIIKFNNFKEAYKLLNELNSFIKRKELKSSDPELYKKFYSYSIKLKWIALPYFNKDEVLRMFNDHFQEAIDMEYFDLWEKLRHFLLGYILMEQRDEIKNNIKFILNKNQAILTKNKLVDNLKPTVENWIKIYTGEVGVSEADIIKIRQFFTDNKNIKELEEQEKEKIIKFFKFYERIKYSSLTVRGFEGSIPVNTAQFKGYFENGEMIKETKLNQEEQMIFNIVSGEDQENNKDYETNSSKNSFSNLEKQSEDINNNNKDLFELASQYRDGSLEKKAIEEEIERLRH